MNAGYGSFNNYLYCKLHNMEKYMKFTMYEKETKDSKYRDDPYRACNFDIDHEGYMVCPNGKRFHFLRSAPVKGNQFGRTEEYYQCEDCTGCHHREKCHKSKDNRVVRINEELTQFHNEVFYCFDGLDVLVATRAIETGVNSCKQIEMSRMGAKIPLGF